MSGLLTPEHLAHVGRSSPPQSELVTRRDIRKYAVATGQRQLRYLEGDVAPPLFYLALFWPVVELSSLTPDGLVPDGLVPDLPLKRAMAGGIRVEYHREVHPGDVLTATRTLEALYEKTGASGPLIFYEVSTRIVGADGSPVLTETSTRILR
jgi:hydroxyacyl-ACP dehydratase HTD2-like protein with hotdog domain